MLKCQACETICEEGANFCRICGRPLEAHGCDHGGEAEPDKKLEAAEESETQTAAQADEPGLPEVLYEAPGAEENDELEASPGNGNGKGKKPEILYGSGDEGAGVDADDAAEQPKVIYTAPDLQAELEAKLMAKIETKLRVEIEQQIRAEMEAAPEPEMEAASEPETEPEMEAASEPEMEAETEPETEPEMEAASEPETEPETEPESALLALKTPDPNTPLPEHLKSFDAKYDVLATTPFQGLQIQTEDEATFFAEEHPDQKAHTEDFSDLDGPRPLKSRRKTNRLPYAILAVVLCAGIAAVALYSGGSGSPSDKTTAKASQTARAASSSAALAARPRQSPPRTRKAAPRNTPSARMSALADSMSVKDGAETDKTKAPDPSGDEKDTSTKTPTAITANEAKNHAPDPTPTATPRPAASATAAPVPAARTSAAPRPRVNHRSAHAPARPAAPRAMPRPEAVASPADQLAAQAKRLLLRNRARAEKLAQQALLHNPSHRVARRVLASVLVTRAKAYLYAGNNQGAIRTATRAVKLNAGAVSAWFYMGVANGELKRTAAARRCLSRFVRMCPKCGYNTAYAKRLLSTLPK